MFSIHGVIDRIRRSAPRSKRRTVYVWAVSVVLIGRASCPITGPVSMPGSSNIREIPVDVSPSLMLDTTGDGPRCFGSREG